MSDKLRILVTGVGAPGTAGTIHCLRNNPDGQEVHLIGTDMLDDVVGRFFTDEFHVVPHGGRGDYRAAIDKIDYDAIVVQTTAECEVLDPLKRAANDKGWVNHYADECDIPCPEYKIVRHAELCGAVHQMGYPGKRVVIKPPVGHGSRGLRILAADPNISGDFFDKKLDCAECTLEGLRRQLLGISTDALFLVSEYLPGPEYSVDAFIGERGAIAIPRERVEMRSGISWVTRVIHHPKMSAWTIELGRILGLTGVFGMQFKENAGGVPCVIECNPRVQGTMVASWYAGINIIWLDVLESLGRSPQAPTDYGDTTIYRYFGAMGERAGMGIVRA